MPEILSSLNEQQQRVVTTTHGPVLVLAGAGSGKTRALTHRIAYLINQRLASPHEILAVTFTNKAAGEMKERVHQLVGDPGRTPRTISTFHSLGVRLLRDTVPYHNRSKNFVVLDAKDSERLIKQALQEHNYSLREWNPRQLKSRISTAKNAQQSPQEVIAAIDGPADEVFARVFDRYEQLLRKHDALDFDDLLRLPVEILTANSDLQKLYQQRWRFLSVDEYQDTNFLQEQMLRLLLGPEQNICVVGDDYQAIYSWRGARVDHILRFEGQYPSCQTIYLTQNYRSTPPILEAANEVISANKDQKHKTLWTRAQGGDPVSFATLPTDRLEARYVRQQIMQYVEDGGELKHCAVLYRTNAQSRLFEEEFLTHRIPYSIVGGFRFYDRREVKDALAFLYLVVNPNSRLPLERIADALFTRVGPKTLDRWEAAAAAQGVPILTFLTTGVPQYPLVQKVAATFAAATLQPSEPVSTLLRRLLEKSGYMDWLAQDIDAEERLQNIEELLNVTSAYTDLSAFLEDVALLSDIDRLEQQQDRVMCMTLHASKGLEFRRVFLVGLEEGLLPHLNSLSDPASMEEERRLLYVGMTRAQQSLIITSAAERYIGGEMVPQIPSRFLQSLPPTVNRFQNTFAYGSQNESSYTQNVFSEKASESEFHEPILMTVSEGELLTHPHFGRGVVIEIKANKLTCVFEGWGVRTIDHASLKES